MLVKDRDKHKCWKTAWLLLSPTRLCGSRAYDAINNEGFEATEVEAYLREGREGQVDLLAVLPMLHLGSQAGRSSCLNEFLGVLAALARTGRLWVQDLVRDKLFLLVSSVLNESPLSCINQDTRRAVLDMLASMNSKPCAVRCFKDLVLNLNVSRIRRPEITIQYLELIKEIYMNEGQNLLDTMPTEKIIFVILARTDRPFLEHSARAMADFILTLISMESLKNKLLTRLVSILHVPEF